MDQGLYYSSTAEAAQALNISVKALYRRVALEQVEGVVRLKEEGVGPGGRPKHGSLHFERGRLRLRSAPPPPPPPSRSADEDDPRNWGRLDY